MIEEEITLKDLKIYELYIQRIMKEGDWFWRRYNICFAVNSGAFIVAGYMWKPFLENKSNLYLPQHIRLLTVGVAVLGIAFSFCWYLMTLDGHRWQDTMSKVLSNIESRIFREIGEDKIDKELFCEILKEYENKQEYRKILHKAWFGRKIIGPIIPIGLDTIEIARFFPGIFIFMWLFAIAYLWLDC